MTGDQARGSDHTARAPPEIKLRTKTVQALCHIHKTITTIYIHIQIQSSLAATHPSYDQPHPTLHIYMHILAPALRCNHPMTSLIQQCKCIFISWYTPPALRKKHPNAQPHAIVYI